MKATKKTFFKLLKVIAKIILVILIMLLLIVLFVRSPWGQDVIVQKYIKSLSEKTETEIRVEKVFVTFKGNIEIDGLFLEDKTGDTLIYSRSLEADIPLLPIIRGNGFAINMVKWEGVRANLNRKDTVSGFNYEFLMDVFATEDTITSPNESSESTTKFSLGTVDLKDFHVQFKDDVAGIDSDIVIGELSGEVGKTDMESMQFHINKVALSNSSIFYEQTKPFPESSEDPEAKLPFLTFNDVLISKVKAHYKSIPEGILLDTEISKFSGAAPKIDLESNDVEISNIVLSNSEVYLEMLASADTTNITSIAVSESEGFVWPEWNIQIDAIKLEENTFAFKEAGAQLQPGVFNQAAFKLYDLNLVASTFDFEDKKSSVAIEELQFLESSGLALNKFTGDISVSDNQIDIRQLVLQLNDNSIIGDGKLSYKSMEDLIERPEDASLSLDISRFNLDLNELFRFQPSLKQNKYIVAATKNSFYGNITASGSLKEIQISRSQINWGTSTRLNAAGIIRNPMDTNQLRFKFPSIKFSTTKEDLDAFVDKESLGFTIPNEVFVTGSLDGSQKNLNANLLLNSTSGKIDLTGSYNLEDQIAFSATAKTIELDLGQLLDNDKLGEMNLQIKASGSGSNINSLDASFIATVDSLQYNNYEINGLEVSGDIVNGEGTFESAYKDKSLNALLSGSILLDSINPVVDVNLEIIGANLQGLGLAARDIRMALDLNANFTGNAESYNLSAGITDGIAVYENQSYLLGSVDVWAHVRPDTTSLSISNKMLDLDLESNASPADFSAAIVRHYRSYFTKNPNLDTILNPVNLKLRGSISQAPILNKVFLTNLSELDSVAIKVDFEEKQRNLSASINLPYMNYYSSEIDSLAFIVKSDKEAFNFDFGFQSLVTGPLDIPETSIKGRLKNEKLDFDFIALHEGEELVAVKTELRRSNDTVYLYFDPSRLVLKNEVWEIPDNNLMTLSDTHLEFQNFSMRNGNQKMEISNDIPNIIKEHLALSFQNFDLDGFLSYFNPEKVLAKGRLDGKFILEEPFGKTGFLADLLINDFEMMSVDLGSLKLDAEALGRQLYTMELGVKGGQVDLDLTGSYKADEIAAAIDLDLNINRVDMASLEGFSRGAVNNGSGSFSGNVSIKGTTADPIYKGVLAFDNAAFTIATLNAGFVLPNESLNIDNDGIYFDKFRIEDENANYFIVDGDVLTESYLNPAFDLSFNANNFKVLNSTKEDNSLFYGVASFDAEGTLKGDLNLPDLDVKLDVGPDTDITYIVPDEELALQEREGVVIFVNKENPDAILTQNEEEAEIFAGYDISALFKIDDEAVFTLVIDEETGDNFRVFGEGDLYLNVYPNGRTTLSGRYEMSGGHYEMSLYSLVKRKFEIADGSTIIWGGDPFDASLDVRAIYEVETSSSALMAPQISSADPAVTSMFRNELDFMVYLNIDGELMQPKISFSLDMPEDEQGAAGGQVYGRIQQLNNQEAELNKQVFSLLVLNRFYPDAGSDGSRGGTIAIARDNLNQALSDQLNIFSDKLLGDTGVELNFGVDSFTDYQGESPEERTQLDITAQKKLFDDRLIVSIGSEVDIQGSSQSPDEPTPVIGNVSIEYLLTKNGRFRLKGFRRNEYENVIDGQLIVSGIALIFTQEFNEFKELWKALAIKNNDANQEENEDNDKSTEE